MELRAWAESAPGGRAQLSRWGPRSHKIAPEGELAWAKLAARGPAANKMEPSRREGFSQALIVCLRVGAKQSESCARAIHPVQSHQIQCRARRAANSTRPQVARHADGGQVRLNLQSMQTSRKRATAKLLTLKASGSSESGSGEGLLVGARGLGSAVGQAG